MKHLLMSALIFMSSCAGPLMAQETNEEEQNCYPTQIFLDRIRGRDVVPIWKGQSVVDGYVVTIFRVDNTWVLTAKAPDRDEVCVMDYGNNNNILVGGL